MTLIRDFLRTVGAAKADADETRDAYLLLMSRCTSTTTSLSGAAVSGTRDVHKDDALIYCAEEGQDYIRAQERYEEAYREVERFLDRIDIPNFRKLLRLRYLQLYPWRYIKKELSPLSEYQVFKLHNDALQYAQKLLHKEERDRADRNR